MGQLERIDRQCMPQQVYLVVDGMTGQDAVNSAKAFNEALELDGVIMTKLDGDARGGAALSVKQVTGVPIKFIGTGEHLDALEEFHPDRMAGRILGQGDLLSLVEKAQQEFDQEEMLRQEERLRKGEFTLDDFRKQLSQIDEARPAAKGDGPDPRHGQPQRGDGRRRSRAGHEAAVRHHRLDDAGRAPQPDQDHRPEPPPPDRRRGRRRAARGERAGEAVRRHGPDDDQHGRQGHEGPHEDGPADAKRHDEQAPTAWPSKKQGTGKRLSNAEKAKLKKQREKELRRRKREQRRGS